MDAGNENEVGQGIKDSRVPREEIFITSKLWNTHQPNVKEGLQRTLDALGTDYLDLYVSCCCGISCDFKTDDAISLFIGLFDWSR
jgi:diketogulonate reductase-like aldo/keto reductase